jgi:hypothetical protein
MLNTRAKALCIGLVVIAAVLLTVVVVSRGGAVSTQTAPNGMAFTVNAVTSSYPYLPLRTPVSISISDSGGGSFGTGSIVACCDGTSWSWIGLNGTGSPTRGYNAKTYGTYMCMSGVTGQYVRLYTATTGRLWIQNASAYPVRVYIHW